MTSAEETDTTGTEATESFDDAFAALFRHAYGVAGRILGSQADAEDVAIETLARAHLHWRHIAARPHAWVTRVSANLAIDELRRRRRRPSPAVVEPVAAAVASDEHLDLERILVTLPRRQRQVLIMDYFDDLTHDAIAAGLDTTAGTVKQHHARGLAALRRRLGTSRPRLEIDDE
jgi:RNA polymerase sigma factor (sigma-70 family)